jgi:hypothetical protein
MQGTLSVCKVSRSCVGLNLKCGDLEETVCARLDKQIKVLLALRMRFQISGRAVQRLWCQGRLPHCGVLTLHRVWLKGSSGVLLAALLPHKYDVRTTGHLLLPNIIMARLESRSQGLVVKTRKRHYKSRTGCFECKRRRVKVSTSYTKSIYAIKKLNTFYSVMRRDHHVNDVSWV